MKYFVRGLSNSRHTFTFLTLAPNNESPWNYLVGMSQLPSFTAHQTVLPTIQSIITQHPDCYHARSATLEIYQQLKDYQNIIEQATLLAEQYDTVREKYWNWRIQQAQTQVEKL